MTITTRQRKEETEDWNKEYDEKQPIESSRKRKKKTEEEDEEEKGDDDRQIPTSAISLHNILPTSNRTNRKRPRMNINGIKQETAPADNLDRQKEELLLKLRTTSFHHNHNPSDSNSESCDSSDDSSSSSGCCSSDSDVSEDVRNSTRKRKNIAILKDLLTLVPVKADHGRYFEEEEFEQSTSEETNALVVVNAHDSKESEEEESAPLEYELFKCQNLIIPSEESRIGEAILFYATTNITLYHKPLEEELPVCISTEDLLGKFYGEDGSLESSLVHDLEYADDDIASPQTQASTSSPITNLLHTIPINNDPFSNDFLTFHKLSRKKESRTYSKKRRAGRRTIHTKEDVLDDDWDEASFSISRSSSSIEDRNCHVNIHDSSSLKDDDDSCSIEKETEQATFSSTSYSTPIQTTIYTNSSPKTTTPYDCKRSLCPKETDDTNISPKSLSPRISNHIDSQIHMSGGGRGHREKVSTNFFHASISPSKKETTKFVSISTAALATSIELKMDDINSPPPPPAISLLPDDISISEQKEQDEEKEREEDDEKQEENDEEEKQEDEVNEEEDEEDDLIYEEDETQQQQIIQKCTIPHTKFGRIKPSFQLLQANIQQQQDDNNKWKLPILLPNIILPPTFTTFLQKCTSTSNILQPFIEPSTSIIKEDYSPTYFTSTYHIEHDIQTIRTILQVNLINAQYNQATDMCKLTLDHWIIDAHLQNVDNIVSMDIWKNIAGLWCIYTNLVYYLEVKKYYIENSSNNNNMESLDDNDIRRKNEDDIQLKTNPLTPPNQNEQQECTSNNIIETQNSDDNTTPPQQTNGMMHANIGKTSEVDKILQLYSSTPSKLSLNKNIEQQSSNNCKNNSQIIKAIDTSLSILNQAIQKCPAVNNISYIWILKSRYTLRKAILQAQEQTLVVLCSYEDTPQMVLSDGLNQCKQICHQGLFCIDETIISLNNNNTIHGVCNEDIHHEILLIKQKKILIDELKNLSYSWVIPNKQPPSNGIIHHENGHTNQSLSSRNGIQKSLVDGTCNTQSYISNQLITCSAQQQEQPKTKYNQEDILDVLDYILELHTYTEVSTTTKTPILKHSNISYAPYLTGQIGIRCIFCSHCELPTSTIYPKSISCFTSAQSCLLNTHMKHCPFLPADIKQRYQLLLTNSTIHENEIQKYWNRIAMDMNMIDNNKNDDDIDFGIRFDCHYLFDELERTELSVRSICNRPRRIDDRLSLLLHQFSICGNHKVFHTNQFNFTYQSSTLSSSTNNATPFITPTPCSYKSCGSSFPDRYSLICKHCYNKEEEIDNNISRQQQQEQKFHRSIKYMLDCRNNNCKNVTDFLMNHIAHCKYMPDEIKKRIESSGITHMDSDKIRSFLSALIKYLSHNRGRSKKDLPNISASMTKRGRPKKYR